MATPGRQAGECAEAVVSIPDLRDYSLINAELVHQLSAGHTHVRLTGAQGQRLLLAGLSGSWQAVVEIEGDAGPELGAALDAPGLTVVCRGSVADGPGRALRAGRLLILGSAGDGLGYTQSGGLIIVSGPAGHRTGSGQSGGILIVQGLAGRLTGERQTGGLLVAYAGQIGPHSGFGRLGGRMLLLPIDGQAATPEVAEDFRVYQQAIKGLSQWMSS